MGWMYSTDRDRNTHKKDTSNLRELRESKQGSAQSQWPKVKGQGSKLKSVQGRVLRMLRHLQTTLL